eukprot:m51a1_g13941 putative agc rsk rsk-unclassified protein kinase (445) ;mRNA; r:881030-882900
MSSPAPVADPDANAPRAAIIPAAGAAMSPANFKRLKLLGRGDVGRVYLVQLLGTEQCFAMKVLPKKEMILRNKVKRVQTEREILSTANHPFIVTLYWSFQSTNCLYFVMEFCAGGEFFRALQRQTGRCLPEKAACFYASEVLLALEYLHMMGFIYRDLKPENILLHGSGHVVLTDFDLSKAAAVQVQPKLLQGMFGKERVATEPGIVSNSFVGTEEYIAPEVITGYGHTSSVDWWTFGILMYEMIFGTTPFRGATRDDTFSQILHGGIEFPENHIYPVGKQAKDLIRSLLNMDPSKRLGAQHGACDVKDHPFFKGVKWNLIRNQTPPIVPQIRTEYDTSYFPELRDDDLIDRLESAAKPGPCAANDPFQNFETSKGPTPYEVPVSPSPHGKLQHSGEGIVPSASPVPKSVSPAPKAPSPSSKSPSPQLAPAASTSPAASAAPTQ